MTTCEYSDNQSGAFQLFGQQIATLVVEIVKILGASQSEHQYRLVLQTLQRSNSFSVHLTDTLDYKVLVFGGILQVSILVYRRGHI